MRLRSSSQPLTITDVEVDYDPATPWQRSPPGPALAAGEAAPMAAAPEKRGGPDGAGADEPATSKGHSELRLAEILADAACGPPSAAAISALRAEAWAVWAARIGVLAVVGVAGVAVGSTRHPGPSAVAAPPLAAQARQPGHLARIEGTPPSASTPAAPRKRRRQRQSRPGRSERRSLPKQSRATIWAQPVVAPRARVVGARRLMLVPAPPRVARGPDPASRRPQSATPQAVARPASPLSDSPPSPWRRPMTVRPKSPVPTPATTGGEFDLEAP